MQYLFTHGTRNEPAKQSEVGEIPESWNVIQFGKVMEAKNGINFSSEQKGAGILTIDVLNMYSNRSYVDISKLYRVDIRLNQEYLLKPDDILFVRSSLKQKGIGWPALFIGHTEAVTFCGFLIRTRLINPEILPEFLVHYFRLPSVRRLLVSKSGKVAITNINQDNLKSCYIPFPQRREQEEIIRVLQTCDAKLMALEKEIALHEELFRALLDELMTGRISTLPLVEQLEKGTLTHGQRTPDGTGTTH